MEPQEGAAVVPGHNVLYKVTRSVFPFYLTVREEKNLAFIPARSKLHSRMGICWDFRTEMNKN